MSTDKPARDPRDFEVCLCFHVPLRKLTQFHKVRRPKVASQFSECFGAGTGCGFCIPFLESIFEQMQQTGQAQISIAVQDYKKRRKLHHKKIGFDEKKELSIEKLQGESSLNLEKVLDEIPDDLKLE